ncbi:hypothetical protein P7C70_g6877, partial [Phenoliferia sp. Uapishka_3]
MTEETEPVIAICGGGLAGLVLARILHKHGIKSAIYERDTSFNSRQHLGGSLDLPQESGQRALVACGLIEEFKKDARPEGEEIRVVDRLGTTLFELEGWGPTSSRPEIDRTMLRKILLDSIPSEFVRWGHQLTSVTPLEDGKHRLVFSGGTEVISDLVVGAEGAWSKVRSLVSDAVPDLTGLTGAGVSLSPKTVERRQDLSDRVGNGLMACLGERKQIFAQRQGDSRIRSYVFHVREQDDFTLPTDPVDAKKVLLGQFERFAPWLRELITKADEEAIYARSLYQLPVGFRWESKPGVTLVGDAAHLMTPFAGEGANCALLDGMDLGLALVRSPPSEWPAAVAKFEEGMWKRAKVAAQESETNCQVYKKEDAAQIFAQQMESHMPPRIVMWALKTGYKAFCTPWRLAAWICSFF